MILKGGTVQKDYFYEVKEWKEIRPGRKLMCRKVTFDYTDDANDDDGHEHQGEHITTLLFVHGSCATSQQYDTLLESLALKQKERGQMSTKFVCYLYDQLGCGESSHPPNDWYAYSSSELSADLQSITQLIIQSIKANPSSSLYIIGHSHGVSQSIRLINSLEKEQTESSSSFIDGAILIGGGLKDAPCEITNDGGHWIFTYMPMFMLHRMQPSLSVGFVNAAFHPTTNSELKEAALSDSNKNDMAMCKAFYRQQKYADSVEAKCLKVRIDRQFVKHHYSSINRYLTSSRS